MPKNTIRQIAQASGKNDVEIRRITYGLLQAGLVEFTRPAGEVGLTKSEEAVLRAMPAGVKYLWCQIQVLQADAGTATSQLSIDHGATEIFTGSADQGATVNTIDIGDASSGAFLPAAAETAGATAGNLIASFTATGTTTTAAKFRVLVCVCRPSF